MTRTAAPPEAAAAELPLFPLHTVLLPGGPLQLQVFEARYLDMVGRCMRTGTPFGVVRILAGSEAGTASDIALTGTSARIIDFHTLSNGLLGLLCIGERVFRLESRRGQSDGLVVGQVNWLPQREAVPVMPQYSNLVAALRGVRPYSAQFRGCRVGELPAARIAAAHLRAAPAQSGKSRSVATPGVAGAHAAYGRVTRSR